MVTELGGMKNAGRCTEISLDELIPVIFCRTGPLKPKRPEPDLSFSWLLFVGPFLTHQLTIKARNCLSIYRAISEGPFQWYMLCGLELCKGAEHSR